MLVDLHAHYPMHVKPSQRRATALRIWAPEGRASLADQFDAAVLGMASRLGNHESALSGPRVTVEGLRRGGVRVVLSVLCTPTLEIGNRFTTRYGHTPPYGGPPREGFLDVALRQLAAVEARVAGRHEGAVRIARSPDDVDAALVAGELALVHCLEGGFNLGTDPASVARGVRELAARGVAYVTLAHLVWRHVATCVPCMPFLSDERYHWIFRQPSVGLSPLGRAAVEAMVEEGVLIDVSHMSAAALDDTFTLLDVLDPERTVPLLASHTGYRFGRHAYNLSAETVTRIAVRDGVIGLILSPYFLADGVPGATPATWEQSFDVLCRHIDRIAEISGSHRHVALGSDLDGFIKPTLPGFEHSARLARLGPALERRYGRATAEAIQSGNGLRVLRAGWRGARSHREAALDATRPPEAPARRSGWIVSSLRARRARGRSRTGGRDGVRRSWLSGTRRPTGERAERLIELSALVERLARVMDPAYIAIWLCKPVAALEDRKPVELIAEGEYPCCSGPGRRSPASSRSVHRGRSASHRLRRAGCVPE